MEYKKIKTVEDVKDFFRHIIVERKVNFHPDDSFDCYINIKDGSNTFKNDEVEIYNKLMDQAFQVCQDNEVDIYELANDLVLQQFKKNKYGKEETNN